MAKRKERVPLPLALLPYEGAPVLSVPAAVALLIVAGLCDVSNHGWYTRHRGTVLIRAYSIPRMAYTETLGIAVKALGWSNLTVDVLPSIAEINAASGRILGVADVVDCVTESASPWFKGPYGLILGRVMALPPAYAGRGRRLYHGLKMVKRMKTPEQEKELTLT